MSGLQRQLVVLGAISVATLIDGTISGIVSAFWGDVWGNRVDDLALYVLAIAGLWRWTGESGRNGCRP